jgi:2'-5' RNA ligase
MRSFVAIEVPGSVREVVFSLRDTIPPQSAKIRWVKKESIHLTLVFLGDVHQEQVENIRERIVKVTQNHHCFSMSLRGAGVFPNKKRPRILWVGVSHDAREKITQLAHEVTDVLDFLELEDKKRFTPHITFGRIKVIQDQDNLLRGIETLSIETERFRVKELTLFKSVLKPDGAVYIPLSKFPLQPS